MSALTSLLVRDQRVPVRKIEEAIQRQVIAGGSLDTVLLELNVVPENVLAAYCAVIHGLQPATREEVVGVESDVIRLVPAPVAERHRLIPLDFANRTLKVAVSTPLEPETEQQLAFLLGVELDQRIVSEASLENALHVHYGVQLSPRMRRLAAKLADRPSGEIPYVAPLEQNTAERVSEDAYRRDSEGAEAGEARVSMPGAMAEPQEVARESAVSITGEGEPPRRTTQEMTSMAPRSEARPATTPPEEVRAEGPARGRVSRAKSELLRRHRGPLTAARAVELLSKADHRDDILEIGFAFTRQFFDFCALFVVQDEEAELLDAAPMDDETLVAARQVVAPLDEPSTFSLVYQGLVPAVGALERSAVDGVVRDALGRSSAQPSVLAPVMIRQRVVLFIYGDRSGEAFGLEDVPELVAFTPKLGEAFQQLILRRKFRGYAKGDARTSEVPEEPATEQTPPSEARDAAPPSAPPKPKPAWEDQKVRSPMKRLEVPAEGQRRITLEMVSAGAPTEAKPPEERARKGTQPMHVGDAFAPTEVEASPPLEPAAAALAMDEGRRRRAFRPSDVTTAPADVTDGPTPLERAVESSLPPSSRSRKRRKRSATFDALGVPRSAPPPPEAAAPEPSGDEGESDEEDPAPALALTEPAPSAESTRPAAKDDAEPLPLSRTKVHRKDRDRIPSVEIILEDQDDGEAEMTPGTPPPQTGPPPEPSTYRGGGQTDVVAPPRRRPKPAGPTPTRDARAEGGRRPLQAEVVPTERPEVTREKRPTLREKPVRHADTIPEETPSIIVEMDESIEEAVQNLNEVGPDSAEAEVAQVIAFGEPALPVLTRDFPGLLWFDRSRPHRRLPRGRDISAVARAIAAFGDRAVPYLVPVLDHPGADERFYATLLASEFRHPLLVEPLGKRVFDSDERTAALAVDVLRMQRRFEEPLHDVVEWLRAEARVPRSDLRKRIAAVRALGALRDVGSLELFVQLLDSDKPELVGEAHRALVALTKQDFGDSASRWDGWVEQNKDRHRIEWLIDGLLHSDEQVRSDAGDELKKLTQEYYGYHPALPKRDREVAQRKYREWWNAEGHRRFGA